MGRNLYAPAVAESYRIGEAAGLLGVRVETLRRWERDGKVRVTRTPGGQRLVPAEEVARLLAEHQDRPKVTARSVRNHFPGVVTEVRRDGVAATVEILAGPHRILALITREAADEMQLEPGVHAVATVKATNVMVEVEG
jgi:molybdopterin-binding protein